MQMITRSLVTRTGELGSHQLLQDSAPLQIVKKDRVMIEDVHGVKVPVMRLAGRFQYAGRPNSNGRIYENEILRHAVKEIQEDIASRRVLGEFDHPPDAKIHLDRVSHLLTKLWMEGNEVIGELEILEKTPCGGILKSLVESGVNIGISSRGVGDMESAVIEDKEYYKVLPGFTFVTFDIVAEPSVQGSYLSVMESRNRLLKTQKQSEAYHGKERDIVKEVHNFLNDLKG
jgi:hypothetical protein